MRIVIEPGQEEDGRWIGGAPDIPGVLAYGDSPGDAARRARARALRVIADRLEHGAWGTPPRMQKRADTER